HPRDANLLNDLGYSYYNHGDWQEAERWLRKSLAVDSHHQRAWINLGMTLGQQERYDESVEAFGHAVRPAEAHCNLAFILTTQGRRQEARQEYEKALALEPGQRLARAAL